MSEQWVILGDTTEGSLYSLAIRGEADVDALRTKCKRLSVIPFESDYAFMLTINKCPLSVYDWWMKNEKDNKEQQDETKEKIIDDKDDDEEEEEIEMIFLKEEDIDIPFWLNETEKVAELGLRALALAQCRLKRKKKKKNEDGKQDEEDQIETPTVDEVRNNREKYPFTIIGVVGIFDPPRPQSLRAVKACKLCNWIIRQDDYLYNVLIYDGDQETNQANIEEDGEEDSKQEAKYVDEKDGD
ncbi:MAG: hypothetical protein EZS28_018613 [Streblomastix strix]|uniref:Uncharacterized protein n=1 Tax=Streblomastix strix TaxID=222440 RepID=A0A5J4VTC1_9EUKA|nr:MAG: hypothetical protein EZS28_018613 [Streblomastix strix]